MPEPLILLSPLRSFSSLVSTMIGQHPQLFGLPELNLFLYDRLEELLQSSRFLRPQRLHGLYRVLAQLHEGRQDEDTVGRAIAWTDAHAQWSTQRVYHHLVELAGDRRLVEKSPPTTLDMANLERMYRCFPQAPILHLTRHPRSTCKSITDIAGRYGIAHRLARKPPDPEQIWLNTHGNILAYTRRLPLGQSLRIQGEQLLGDPALYFTQIAQWLGLREDDEAIAAMLRPEESPFAHEGPSQARYGNDPNFLANPVFRPGQVKEAFLDGELEWAPGKHFTPATRALAWRFGYR